MDMEAISLIWTRGDRLAKARRLGSVSTTEMADELGVSRKTINNYEADRTPVRAGTLKVWAHKCKVSYQWLSTGEGTPELGEDDTIWSAEIPERDAA